MLVLVIAIPWTLVVVNAVNFMDGINGISAATAIVGGGAYGLFGQAAGIEALTILGTVVAAAGLGFAPYNLPRARVFLGDVGSYGIGAAFAAMSLWVSHRDSHSRPPSLRSPFTSRTPGRPSCAEFEPESSGTCRISATLSNDWWLWACPT